MSQQVLPGSGYRGLSHRSNTGKKLPKGNTSYPALLFILLCLGVLLTGVTLKTNAATIKVTARANGPPPPAPALITSPTEGIKFNSKPIKVEGTCPAGYVVKLYRNSVFSGNVLCGPSNTFEIQTDLFFGNNLLNARIFNLVDDEGPSSPTITVNYTEPSILDPSSVDLPRSESTELKLPLILKTASQFQGYYVGETIEWKMSINGGKAPYAVSIDWGDGNSSVFSRASEGPFVARHTYEQRGGYKDGYVVKVNASDSEGQRTFLQLSVIVHDNSAIPFAYTSDTGLASATPIRLSLKYMWPLYGVTLLMAISFWLGEKREYLRLRPQLRAKR